MKTKKILAGVLAMATLLACTSFAGCRDISDIAPKAYGEWDGNYIYRGNVRSKTTGEDDEYLIKTVMYNDVEYTVTQTTDFEYVGDDIYLCMTLGNETTCFARYNVKDKTSETLYFETKELPARHIRKITDDFVILDTYDGVLLDYTLFRIDYEGNVLSNNDSTLNDYTDLGDYLIDCEDGKFSYRHWEEEAFTEMFTLPHEVNNFQAQYIDRDGKTGFLIKAYSTDNQGQNLGGVYFYDLTGTMYELIGQQNKQECYLEGDYILTGERVKGTYTESYTDYRSIFFWTWKTKTREVPYSMLQNCKLYKIDWSASEELLKEVYDFTYKYEKIDLWDYTLLDDGRIFFRADGVYFNNDSADMDAFYFILDPATGELEETDVDETRMTEEKLFKQRLASGERCGKYIYYSQSVGFTSFLEEAYHLYRYDTETETLETMQFWRAFAETNESDYEEETQKGTVRFRWSPKMWREQGGASGFIVRNY